MGIPKIFLKKMFAFSRGCAINFWNSPLQNVKNMPDRNVHKLINYAQLFSLPSTSNILLGHRYLNTAVIARYSHLLFHNY